MNAPSQISTAVQLRVLAGLHEGAVVPIDPESPLLQLAASGAPDILLRDAPGSAQLLQEAGQWLWRETGFEQPLQPGQAWRWGPVVLALAAAAQPWPEQLPTLVFDRQPDREPPAPEPPSPNPQAEPSSAEQPKAEPEGRAAAEPAEYLPETAPAAVGRGKAAKSGSAVARWVLAIALVLCALLAGLWFMVGQGPVRPQAPAASPVPTLAPVNLAQVKKAVNDLGMGALVRAELRSDGRLLLTGVLADDEQIESLMRAVTAVTRRVSPRLITQAEFEARGRALAANLPEGIQALPEPGGLLVLQAAREDVDWVLARQLVDSELPEAVAVDHRQVVPATATLRAAPVQRSPAVNAFVPRSALPPSAAAASAAPAATLPPSAAEPLKAQVQPPAPAFPEPPAIAAVVGGPRPFLLMASGEKWQPGGKVGPLILQSITNEAIVFEDDLGRTFRRAR